MATGDAQVSSAFATYKVDTRVSQFTVQAFASGLISAAAHSPKIAIRDWEGSAQMRSRTFEGAFLEVRLKANSLEVLDELRDDDRRMLQRVMNDEVLESTRYPEIVFKSSEIRADKVKEDSYRLAVRGRLNLHGITNEQDFVGQVTFGVDTAWVHGEFTILQSDYDIRIASIAGGTMKLQDELKFRFYVVARRVEAGEAS